MLCLGRSPGGPAMGPLSTRWRRPVGTDYQLPFQSILPSQPARRDGSSPLPWSQPLATPVGLSLTVGTCSLDTGMEAGCPLHTEGVHTQLFLQSWALAAAAAS